MTTADGRLVTQHNRGVPTPRDLATSLGRVPRFVGHTRTWWTVLHHVAHCYKTLERAGWYGMESVLRLPALLHDSEESIVGDLPTPWKLPDRREQEERLCRRIMEAYGCEPELDPEYIRAVDAAVLRIECRSLGPPHVEHHSGLAYLADPDPALTVHASLAFAEVQRMKHDPFEPAESELGCWYLRRLEEAVGDAARWKLLTQVAP